MQFSADIIPRVTSRLIASYRFLGPFATRNQLPTRVCPLCSVLGVPVDIVQGGQDMLLTSFHS
jgi:hypothetical protein